MKIKDFTALKNSDYNVVRNEINQLLKPLAEKYGISIEAKAISTNTMQEVLDRPKVAQVATSAKAKRLTLKQKLIGLLILATPTALAVIANYLMKR